MKTPIAGRRVAGLLTLAVLACQGPDRAGPSPEYDAHGVARTIQDKFSAITVPAAGVDEIQPGDHVDVLTTVTDLTGSEPVAVTVMQDVVVLATGDDVDDPATAALPRRLVTLEVLPEETELVLLAAAVGTVQLTLRNPEDIDLKEERGRTTIATLLAGERVKALQTLRYRTIQIIRGTESRGSANIDLTGGWQGSATAAVAPEISPQPLMDRAVASPKLGKVVYRDENGQFQPLPIRALRAVVHIEGPRARTIVDLVVENPFSRILEGTLRYPLPQDASPAFFATFQGAPSLDPEKLVKTPGRILPELSSQAGAKGDLVSLAPRTSTEARIADWQELRPARVVGREQGAQVYEQVTRRRVDPALLEWAGGNDFEARIYPIAPHSLKRVVFVYEQTLAFDGAFTHYGFPLPESPIPELEARLFVDADKAEVAALSVAGEDQKSAFGAKADPFRVAELTLSGKAFTQGLQLALRPRDARVQVVAGGGDAALPGTFVYARVFAQVPRVEAAPTGDALFVVDTSLSEDGDRARMAGQMLEAVLSEDPTIRRFNVLLFDVKARWLFPAGMVDNSKSGRDDALRALGPVWREGATSLESALALIEGTSWSPAGATAFLLSDGQLTWGESSPRALLKRAPRAASLRWIAYRFGEAAVNRELFDALTRRDGQIVTCLAGSQVAASAMAHRRPMMQVESIGVEGMALHDLVVRASPQALFDGQEIELAGRALGEQARTGQVVIKGSLDGKPLVLRYPLEASGSDMLAPRAWAELHVERLLAIHSPKLDRLIIALSQHFGMTNRLASLIILETDREYTQYDLRKEEVSIAEVEAAARSALAKAEDLAGLDLAGVPPEGRRLIQALPNTEKADPLEELELQPALGGSQRAWAETAFRETRKKAPEDLLAFDSLSRARFFAGDTLGAVRAISSIVELRPLDPEASRLVGFELMEQGLHPLAAQVLGRLRATRGFEVQTYLQEALALEESGRVADAARDYEIVLARHWERQPEVVEAGRQHYVQLLRRTLKSLGETQREVAKQRLAMIDHHVPTDLDLQVTIHWNVDDIDVDLWVTGPDGERCFYSHPVTATGGRLFWDVTTGYGPELFQQARAAKGPYLAQVHYFGNNGNQWAIPSVVLGVLDQQPNSAKRHLRRFTVQLLTRQGESVKDLFRLPQM